MYVVFSCLWIGFSDRVLFWTVSTPSLITLLSTVKGFLFVAVTALLWHSLMAHNAKRISNSQSAYRALFDSSPIPIVVSSYSNGKTVDANDSFIRLSGYSREELIGRTASELGIYPDDENSDALLKKLNTEGRVHSASGLFRTKSGETRNILRWLELVSLDENEYVHALAIDVTEKLRAERELRESEQRFATVFNANPICMSLTRMADRKFFDVNQEFLSLLEYEREEVLGSDPLALKMWVDEGDRANMVHNLVTNGRADRFESRFRTKNGSIKDVRVIAELIEVAGEKYILGLSEDVTARKQADENVRLSEERFRKLFEESPIGIAFLGQEREIFLTNQRYRDFLGYTEAEIRSLGPKGLLHPDDWEPSLAMSDRLRNGSIPLFHLEQRYVRKDGAVVWSDTHITPVRDKNGTIIHTIGWVQDITDKKRWLETLAASETKLRAILDNSSEAIGVHVNGVWEECNAAAIRLFGVSSPKELIGQSILGVIAPEERSRIDEFVRSRGGMADAPTSYITRGLKADGSMFDMEVSLATYVLDGRQQVLVVLRDVTERKQAEERLRESEERFRQLADAAVEGIGFSENGVFVNGNRRLAEMLGYDLEEMIGLPVSGFIAPEDRPLVMKHIRDNYVGQYEHSLLRKDGSTLPVDSHARTMKLKGKMVRVSVLLDINERKRKEQELSDALERYRLLFEMSPDAISQFDNDLNVVRMNPAAVHLFGFHSEAESVGRNSLDYVEPADLEDVMGTVRTVFDKGSIQNVRHRLRRTDGTSFPSEMSGSLLRGPGGYPAGVIVVIRDISKQINSEQLLRESNEKFEKIFQAAPLMVSLSSVEEGRFLEVNETAVRLCGFSRDEVIGKSSTEIGLISQMDRDRIARVLRENGTVDDIQLVLHRKDGTAFFCSYGARIVSVGGKDCLLSVSQDITDKMEAEERLRTLSRAVEQSPASVVITDINGVIEYVNPKFTEVTQYNLDEAVGRRPSILKTGATPQAEYAALWKTILSGEVWQGEFCNRKKNGDLYWESASISPIVDKEGNIVHFVAVKEDITDKKKAEARRAELEQQLFQAQKMEGIGTLASGIAHDFNNILNTIVGSASLIEERPDQVEKVRQRISRVLKSAERGTQVVKQLMTLARKTALQRKTTDMNEMLEELARLIDETFPETIEIRLNLAPSLPLINVDANQIHQVVLNLCSNARDAMPKGGELRLETKMVLGADLRLRHPEAEAHRYLELIVSDTGEGIEESVLKRIFDPFFTTKDIGKGTGLGLSVAHAIIESHRGLIEVDSCVGVGSEFRIFLPGMDGPGFALPTADQGLDNVTGGNETILFIDDDENIRDMSVEFLQDKGYTVITAVNGVEGVEQYSAHLGDIALVLSDFGLPKINGEEVYRRVRAISPSVPFILLTGLIEPEKRSELMALGIHDVIEKPYKPADVLLKIREVLDSGM